MAIISLKNMSISRQKKEILRGITLDVNAGEVLVVCGKSGSGKSTLLQFLGGLIPELYPATISGEARVLEQQLPYRENQLPFEQQGFVFQNPKTQFFTQDVYSELAFPMENAAVEQPIISRRVVEISQQYDLESNLYRTMFELSGGQKQMVALGAASSLNPDILFFDEPSSNLDEYHTNQLTNQLVRLKQKGHTLVIAEHRLAYLKEVADRFLYLPEGRIFRLEELALQSPSEMNRLGLRSLEISKLNSQNQRYSLAKPTQTLVLENIFFQYKSQEKQRGNALSIDSLELSNEGIIGLIGENGAGKSTLSQIITGLLKPSKGTIHLNGVNVRPKQLIEKSFLVMQDVNLQLFFETVEKEVQFKNQRIAETSTVIEWLGLEEKLKTHPHHLSEGEKQRVAIATALLSGKEILVFDEPTSGLDLESMKEVSKRLQEVHQLGMLVLVISHDQEFLARTCQRFIRLEKGRVIEDSKRADSECLRM